MSIIELTDKQASGFSGGKLVQVPTKSYIQNGIAYMEIDLRGGLRKNPDFSGDLNTTAEFDDFTGKLKVSGGLDRGILLSENSPVYAIPAK